MSYGKYRIKNFNLSFQKEHPVKKSSLSPREKAAGFPVPWSRQTYLVNHPG
jgi:hypothetical protein